MCPLLEELSKEDHSFIILITKSRLYKFDPLKPHLYIVKLWFTGVYVIFLILLKKNIDCGYSLEPPYRGSSNKYPQSMFFSRNRKNKKKYIFFSPFLVIKFSIYLNRCVFVMYLFLSVIGLQALVAQSDAQPNGDREVVGSTPAG